MNRSAERPSIRVDARLDHTTRQMVDDLARHFHRPRAAVLCHIMQWGISRERTAPIDQGACQGPVRHLHLYIPADLYAQVQKAAAAARLTSAPWLRHMVRQISMTDFPASWQAARPAARSHDSHAYGKRFMLRLGDSTWETLDALSTYFETSAAEIIRQLIVQARREDFPTRWQMRVAERQARQPRQDESSCEEAREV